MINFTKLKGGKTVKGKVFRKLMAVFISMMLIVSMGVPAAADEILEGAPEAAEVGLNSEGFCGEDARYTWNESTGVLDITGTGKIETNYFSYESGAFYNNPKIKSVIIHEGITQIGHYFFHGSTNIKSVVIPKSCILIGEHAFYKVSDADFYYNGTREEFWNIKIKGTNMGLMSGRLHFGKGKEHLFTDVTNRGAFFYNPVDWAATKKVTTGTGDGSRFEPYLTCNRAMIVTLLYRLAGKPKVNAAGTFKDVPKGSWYYDAVYWAVEKGITTGYGNGTFQPFAKCTRAMLVTFLHRFYNGGTYDPVLIWGTVIPDVPNGSWYQISVYWAYYLSHIATGKGDGLFHPNDPCTRGEAMTFLYRLMNEGNDYDNFDQTL